MIYEAILKIFGAGIASMVQFVPLSIDYDDTAYVLTIESTLTAPVTNETRRLVEKGWPFAIEYTISLIVNDTRAYRNSIVRELTCNNNRWFIDNSELITPYNTLQQKMGSVITHFNGMKFDANDAIALFVMATIRPDSAFTASTAMRTEVLWNCYVPVIKDHFSYTGERFIRK